MFNENWYSNEQCMELAKLVSSIKHLEGDIIEIGCWEGKSTTYIANTCYPENIICNDTWRGNIDEGIVTGVKHSSTEIAETRDVYSRFIDNMNTLTKGNYIVKKMDCHDFMESYTRPIKFLHIDASHDYESVYKSIKMALPLIIDGGILCGDDFLSANMGRTDLQGGVERAVRELLPGFGNKGNLWYWYNQ